jgi:hypothetical protein
MDKWQIFSIITYCNVNVFRFPGLIEKLLGIDVNLQLFTLTPALSHGERGRRFERLFGIHILTG